MLWSSLCDLRDAYIVVKGTITVGNTAVAGKEANKQITLDLKTGLKTSLQWLLV